MNATNDNYEVRAQVVDIRDDNPTKEDIFLVDSHIWLWCYYDMFQINYFESLPEDLQPHLYQIRNYPKYIEKVRNIGASLLYCGLSLTEIAHRVEVIEKQLFMSRKRISELSLKDYRYYYPEQREIVFKKVRYIWNRVTYKRGCIDIQIKKATTEVLLGKFKSQLLDGYDFLLVEAMNNAKVKKIITDDRDYLTVPNITVFSSNKPAIDTARDKNKLLNR